MRSRNKNARCGRHLANHGKGLRYLISGATAPANERLETIRTYDIDLGLAKVDRRGRVRDKWSDYKRAARAVAEVFRDSDPRRYERMRHCADFVWAVERQGVRHVVSANLCDDPLCPVCSWRRSLEQFARLKKAVVGLPVSHLVLTLKNREKVSGLVDDLWAYWRKLSRRKWFRQLVSGYYVSMEFTWSFSHGWHGHLHVLAVLTGEYSTRQLEWWKREFLEVEWENITSDSFICFWERVSEDDAIHEVTKYVSDVALLAGRKGGEVTFEAVRDLAAEIRGRKMHVAGGIVRRRLKESEDMLSLDVVEELMEEGTVTEDGVNVEEWRWDHRAGKYVLARVVTVQSPAMLGRVLCALKRARELGIEDILE